MQSVTVALAYSNGAQRISYDTFGNPICSAVLNQAKPDPAHGSPAHLPAFCSFGCDLFVPSLAAPSSLAILVEPEFGTADIVYLEIRAADPVAPDHSSGAPRAPPLTA